MYHMHVLGHVEREREREREREMDTNTEIDGRGYCSGVYCLFATKSRGLVVSTRV